MNEEKRYKILSIDGGGIKGLYSAYILKHICDEYKIDLNEYFDLFCGTSTGGIIALGLASGLTINQIIDFYVNKGPEIFLYKNPITYAFSTVIQLFWKGKYSNKNLKNSLVEVFGNKKIMDLPKNICIPTVRLSNQQLTVLKKDYRSDLTLHNEVSLVDAALATSAAPTYFPIINIKELGNGSFVDGGLGSNDPSLIGAIEATRYLMPKGMKFDLLSVSSVSVANGSAFVGNKRRWSPLWFKDILELIMNVQSKSVYFNMSFLKDILPCNKYIKIPSPSSLSPEQRKYVKLDYASDKALKTLEDLAFNTWAEAKKLDEVREFFSN
jgi:uncharacterized protein